MGRFDTVVLGGQTVLPGRGPVRADIGIKDGRISAIGEGFASGDADEVVDASGKLVLPGAVDAHFHLGIYRDITEDTESETLSSLAGGVTSVISYFRTGSHYLEKSGPYAEIFPEVLEATNGHSRVDFGYHLAPMVRDQVDEIERLASEEGVTSFKYYMFYKGLDLSGASSDASGYTMSENYDLGHLFEIMEQVARAQGERTDGSRISLSIHCEQPELIRVFSERVKEEGVLSGLEAYSASRPSLTEHLAVAEVAVLAEHTRCPINLAASIQRGGLRGGAGVESAEPLPRRAAGDDAPPPGADLRELQRPAWQGQPSHKGPVGRGRALARGGAWRDRLGMLGSRLLL